ncbi:MAG: isochorismatase family protein [Acidimicrobiales bacterium]
MSDDALGLAALREFYQGRQLGSRVGFGESPTLIVVDMSRAFLSDEYSVGARNDDLVANVARLVDAARAAGLPIVYTTVSYTRPDQAGYWGIKIPGLHQLQASDPNATCVHPALQPAAEDIVINKHYSSAFFGTDLQSILTRLRADTVVVCGVSTSGCVRATVVDAVSYGYRVIVPRDCVGDRATVPNEATLFDIDSKYGDVVDANAVIGWLSEKTRRGDPR